MSNERPKKRRRKSTRAPVPANVIDLDAHRPAPPSDPDDTRFAAIEHLAEAAAQTILTLAPDVGCGMLRAAFLRVLIRHNMFDHGVSLAEARAELRHDLDVIFGDDEPAPPPAG